MWGVLTVWAALKRRGFLYKTKKKIGAAKFYSPAAPCRVVL